MARTIPQVAGQKANSCCDGPAAPMAIMITKPTDEHRVRPFSRTSGPGRAQPGVPGPLQNRAIVGTWRLVRNRFAPLSWTDVESSRRSTAATPYVIWESFMHAARIIALA